MVFLCHITSIVAQLIWGDLLLRGSLRLFLSACCVLTKTLTSISDKTTKINPKNRTAGFNTIKLCPKTLSLFRYLSKTVRLIEVFTQFWGYSPMLKHTRLQLRWNFCSLVARKRLHLYIWVHMNRWRISMHFLFSSLSDIYFFPDHCLSHICLCFYSVYANLPTAVGCQRVSNGRCWKHRLLSGKSRQGGWINNLKTAGMGTFFLGFHFFMIKILEWVITGYPLNGFSGKSIFLQIYLSFQYTFIQHLALKLNWWYLRAW